MDANATDLASTTAADDAHLLAMQHAMRWSHVVCYQLVGFPLSLLGVVGNMMSIHIWTQKEMHWGVSSTSWYLVALSTSDILYLLTVNFGVILPDWMRWTDGGWQRMFGPSETVAHLRSVTMPLSDNFVNISIYLVVAFTAERFVAVTYPLKGRIFCTPRKARYVIVALVAAVTALHVPGYLEHNVLERRGESDKPWFQIGYNWGVMVLVFAMAPVLLLSFFNAMLIRQVHRSRNKQRTMTMHVKRESKVKDRSSEKFAVVTMTVVLIVVTFVLCHTPAAIILCTHTYKSQFGELGDSKYDWGVAANVANLLSIVNSSINFLLYSIFSHKFRKTAARRYCRWRCMPAAELPSDSAAVSNTYSYTLNTARPDDSELDRSTELPLLSNIAGG